MWYGQMLTIIHSFYPTIDPLNISNDLYNRANEARLESFWWCDGISFPEKPSNDLSWLKVCIVLWNNWWIWNGAFESCNRKWSPFQRKWGNIYRNFVSKRVEKREVVEFGDKENLYFRSATNKLIKIHSKIALKLLFSWLFIKAQICIVYSPGSRIMMIEGSS